MRTKTACGAALGLLLCSLPLPTGRAQQASRAPELTADQWQADLRYFATELERRHKNLYHTVPRQEFQRAVSELDAAIPGLEAHQIIVRMRQISALVGDGHTGVHIPSWFSSYPISLYWFGKELRVTGATKQYERSLGARLVQIDGMAIDQVVARIRTCFPSAENENEWFALSASPAFIVRPEILHTLGAVKDRAKAAFTFEDDRGERFTLEITPVPAPMAAGGIAAIPGMAPASAGQPLFRQKPGERFWFTYLPEQDLVYVSFRGYQGMAEPSARLFRLIDSIPVRRVVIDLRQNGGGDFFEGRRYLLGPLSQRPAINQKGNLFVIIGRRTFSAAMVNAIDFRKRTNAILVGEPIGERPNSHSENDELTLPNSGVVVSYSTRYYKFLDQDVPAVLPDVRIDPDWASFKAGRDPVMEWILRQPR